ncbi:hypothetical protein [Nakamurella sp. PAMC28650]|uniref:hypothetical protein n=1 Tax=Nakamurella sp. PAMC28650 TaxID=2762325 RepID=UPI00164DEECE|nr:hypothetical protein [Nakamurella sp. PAMC28650]QNK82312.1 hypothetical protein H7F38_06120 [Nakamurella sp. PAMC28650]
MTTPAYPSSTVNTPLGRPAPTPPSTVKGAFLVYLIAALISVVGIVLVVTSNVWDQAIAAAGTDVTADGTSATSLASAAKIATIVVGVIFIGLYLLFAFKMRAGRNWARIVLTVLSALSILSAARTTASISVNGQVYSVGSSQATGWIGAALAVVAIVLMYTGASNAYFTASKAARKGL